MRTLVKINSQKFKQDMNNIVEYSLGFLDGTQAGKTEMFAELAPQIAEIASQFIDSNARVSPHLLHHIYEWYQTGSPKARLFNIDFQVNSLGINFIPNFKQSTTIKNGSNTPFYDKASIMEKGLAVTIKPKRAKVLAFDIDGEKVFTPNEVVVENPGGQTQGQFEKVINEFFNMYMKQSFLTASGLRQYFNNPIMYKQNIAAGKRGGKSVGFTTGFKWVVKAGAMIR